MLICVLRGRIYWKGSMREVLGEIRRLKHEYNLLADLISDRLN
ncbi:MAG: hypothetical protein QHH02_06180 [Syntrophomonadaceae bacterium]|nr:hypothetical protein [Syntrophomonadaceae bacterium]